MSEGAAPTEAPAEDYAEDAGTQSADYTAAQATETAATTVSDGEVEEFAAIQVEVSAIQQELQTEAQKKDADVQQLQNEFTRKASGIIENSALSRERFEQIVEQVSNDPDLQSRLRQAIEKRI